MSKDLKLNAYKYIRYQTGFTLLEIIIALGIAVVALVGVYGGLIQNVKNTAEIDERLIANWVAANAIAEMRLESREGVLVLKNDTIEMGGRNWRYEMTETDAPNPLIAKVDVQVFHEDDRNPSNTITAYVQRNQ